MADVDFTELNRSIDKFSDVIRSLQAISQIDSDLRKISDNTAAALTQINAKAADLVRETSHVSGSLSTLGNKLNLLSNTVKAAAEALQNVQSAFSKSSDDITSLLSDNSKKIDQAINDAVSCTAQIQRAIDDLTLQNSKLYRETSALITEKFNTEHAKLDDLQAVLNLKLSALERTQYELLQKITEQNKFLKFGFGGIVFVIILEILRLIAPSL